MMSNARVILAILLLIHNVCSLGFDVDYDRLFGTSPRGNLPFPELVAYDGYTSQNYTVTTEDGYLLTMFRIPIQKSCNASKGVILFMHGLSTSSDDCIVPGPGRAHCYIYADNCYDLWVPNERGNRYSRNHLTLDPNTDPKFWDFAFDEIALYDVSAFIDFALKMTGEKQLTYIGHSQGVTTLLALCSKRPEYNNKIRVGFSLSGAAWYYESQFYFRQIVFDAYIATSPIITQANNYGINTEVLPYGSITPIVRKFLCLIAVVRYPYCTIIVFAFGYYNEEQISKDLLPVIIGHNPNGVSLKAFNRLAQLKMNGFSEYDYGYFLNWLVYRAPRPPLYNVSNIKMPWVFAASLIDNIAKVSDLTILTDRLENYDLCIHKDLNHFDFVYGKTVQNSLAPMVLNYLENGNTNCFLQ